MSKPFYRAVIISPHLDDAVFSCGGAIAKLAQEGPVLVLNLFTRYLSDFKSRAVVFGNERYEEEIAAASFLGFESRNLGELDAAFRRKEYRKLGNIFRPPVAADIEWLPSLRQKVFATLAEINYQHIYVPLGIGWHVDHVITHLLFENWADFRKIIFYEESPYCLIPHSTRYRLNELAAYEKNNNDLSLLPTNEFLAWLQTSQSYTKTAMMKNLKPWLLRFFAVPTVSFYFYRLMAQHRRFKKSHPNFTLKPELLLITDQFERKIQAMALYRSQFKEFFLSQDDCRKTLVSYANRMQQEAVERYWKCQP